MHCKVVIRTLLSQGTLEERLATVASGGPFRVQDLVHAGGDEWTFTLLPARPGLAIGFGKVAEMLVLLSRDFDVDRVERFAKGPLAAAS